MSDISPLGSGSIGPAHHRISYESRVVTASASTLGERVTDRAEVSDHARYVNAVKQLPDVRQDVVDRVRAAIQSGDYPNEEQLDLAMDALIDDLRS